MNKRKFSETDPNETSSILQHLSTSFIWYPIKIENSKDENYYLIFKIIEKEEYILFVTNLTYVWWKNGSLKEIEKLNSEFNPQLEASPSEITKILLSCLNFSKKDTKFYCVNKETYLHLTLETQMDLFLFQWTFNCSTFSLEDSLFLIKFYFIQPLLYISQELASQHQELVQLIHSKDHHIQQLNQPSTSFSFKNTQKKSLAAFNLDNYLKRRFEESGKPSDVNSIPSIYYTIAKNYQVLQNRLNCSVEEEFSSNETPNSSQEEVSNSIQSIATRSNSEEKKLSKLTQSIDKENIEEIKKREEIEKKIASSKQKRSKKEEMQSKKRKFV